MLSNGKAADIGVTIDGPEKQNYQWACFDK